MEEINETEEIIIVTLKTVKFKIIKKNLIDKSQYFAALLSGNYTDHLLSEHKINYEIPLTSFEDFVNWMNCDNQCNIVINAIESYIGRLLTLLELSVLFVVHELTETITDILKNCYLPSENVLNVWLMAQDLGLNVLRDLSFSVCLDRFTELPLNLIYELSKEQFLQLVEHINLRIPKTIDAEAYLSTIAQEWMKVNKDTILLDNLKKSGPKVYHSIISYGNSEFYLYFWDGDKFFKFATIRYPEEPISKTLIEEGQIISRGYNLYFIGGKFNIGPRIFNTKIYNTKVWRYSLITKNWHFETIMPCERRFMIAAFVQNKLLLVGGSGSDNKKLTSIDIYDVHKGTWTKGMDIPLGYLFDPYDESSDCSYTVIDKHLICSSIFEKDYVYIYNSETNYWHKVERKSTLHLHDLHVPVPIIKQFKSASYYFDVEEGKYYLENIVCDNLEYKQKFYEKYAEYLRIEENYKEESNMYFYFKADETYKTYDYCVLFCSKNENVEYKLIHLKTGCLPWHTMPIQDLGDLDMSFSWFTMISNVMNPVDLYINSI